MVESLCLRRQLSCQPSGTIREHSAFGTHLGGKMKCDARKALRRQSPEKKGGKVDTQPHTQSLWRARAPANFRIGGNGDAEGTG